MGPLRCCSNINSLTSMMEGRGGEEETRQMREGEEDERLASAYSRHVRVWLEQQMMPC